MTYILLLAGFLLLIKGADILVDGASSFAKRYGVSPLVIGLTIVAFGTSAPELAVNIFASIKNNTDLAIANIVGSNIANILLILGVTTIIYPVAAKKSTLLKEIPFSLLGGVVLFVLANDIFISNYTTNTITRSDGIIFLLFFIFFIYYLYSLLAINKKDNSSYEDQEILNRSIKVSIFMIFAGLAGLVLGGKWIVDSAVSIATSFGLSEAFIGVTIVAIGTSLPELAASVVAALKKQTDIAIGNVVGSNVFNIFWILGISAVINPLPFSSGLNFDLFWTIFSSLVLFVFIFASKNHTLGKKHGIAMLILYTFYIGLLVYRI